MLRVEHKVRVDYKSCSGAASTARGGGKLSDTSSRACRYVEIGSTMCVRV